MTRLIDRAVLGHLPFLVVFVCLLLGPAIARAQTCGISTRTPFAGHNFPLDGNLVQESFTVTPAFPSALESSISGDPVGMAASTDGTNRIFLITKGGESRYGPSRVYVFDNDPNVQAASVFLELTGLVDGDFLEEGLIGIAIHPDHATNGYVYVHYTSLTCAESPASRCQRIVRYTADGENPNVADPTSAYVVLEIPRPGSNENHNGGDMAFGGDGMLYIGVGDQGLSSGSEPIVSQDTTSLRGKVLRIDVDSGTEFDPGIPADNPFGNAVWHYGLRNPWRISFDRENPNDLWIADVGGANREEVNWVPAQDGQPVGGLNFDWPNCEGTVVRGQPGTPCSQATNPPDLEYDHSQNRVSVIGGFVYRGQITSLFGRYIFADWLAPAYSWDRVSREATPPELGIFQSISSGLSNILAFGEDEAGELYALQWFGGGGTTRINRFETGATSPGDPFPELLSETGLFSDTPNLLPAPGMIEYAVTSPLWSDAALKKRWIALPGNEQIGFAPDGSWTFPVGTVFVKHFELDSGGGQTTRLETRVMLRQTDRWTGFTYKWNGNDANLLRDEVIEDVDLVGGGTQTWIYPSPKACLTCHTAPAGRILGVRTRQLNGVFDYGAVTDNQLHAWNCIGLFDTDIGDPAKFVSHSAPDDTNASRQHRVRSYLGSNCSICHLPGTAVSPIDLRPQVLLGEMKAIGEPPIRGDLGVAGADVIDPGDHANSVLWLRMDTTDANVRMAKGTLLRDVPMTDMVRDWIDQDLWNSSGGSAFLDSDEDGLDDVVDNCPGVANPLQTDSGGDPAGDACDAAWRPELAASSDNPASIGLGDALSVGADVANAGLQPAAVTQLRVHLSEDDQLDAGDTKMGECFTPVIDAAGQESCSVAAVVPPDLVVLGEGETADWHWIACADTLAMVDELDETNNCGIAPVMIPEPPAAAANLAALLTVGAIVAVARRTRAV